MTEAKHQHGTSRVSGNKTYIRWLLTQPGWKLSKDGTAAEKVHCLYADTPQKSKAGKRRGAHFPTPCEGGTL